MGVLEQTFATVPVGELTPHPDNPRRGDVDLISASIDAHGFFGACVVQRSTGYILVGNHRWLAASKAGQADVPVLWVDVDDEAAKRILIADNRTAEMASWDEATLGALLTELSATSAGLAGLAFSEADLGTLMEAQAGAAAPTGENVLASLDVVMADPIHEVHDGEVWLLERHRLVVARVMTDWPLWAPLLDDPEIVLACHPSPYLPLSVLAHERPLLMVTSSHYLAGHVLDKWSASKGEPRLLGQAAA